MVPRQLGWGRGARRAGENNEPVHTWGEVDGLQELMYSSGSWQRSERRVRDWRAFFDGWRPGRPAMSIHDGATADHAPAERGELGGDAPNARQVLHRLEARLAVSQLSGRV